MEEIVRQINAIQPRLLNLLVNPASNTKAAFALYGIIAVCLLLAVVAALFFLLGNPDDEEIIVDGRPVVPKAPAAPKAEPLRRPRSPRAVLIGVGVAALVILAVWAFAGYTTSASRVCVECHTAESTHVKDPAVVDPHAKVECVSCHEDGGVLGLYALDLPARLTHFADSQVGMRLQDNYGDVTSRSCSLCHAAALKGVVTDTERGLRVSHKEPLAASATCLDCHALSGGVVAGHNAGMAPCLRCHNSKRASATCTTCHDQNVASAARSRTTTFSAEQISDITCGGCHDEKKDCDTCHGVRLPHSREFVAYAHGRAGAVDFWYNGGKTCKKCHTATNRPCQKCHSTMLGIAHGNPSDLPQGHQAAMAQGCDTCHATYAYSETRDFCRDICHAPAAKANSPR